MVFPVFQDFTSVPAVVDLSAIRDAPKRRCRDPNKINPLVSYKHLFFFFCAFIADLIFVVRNLIDSWENSIEMKRLSYSRT